MLIKNKKTRNESSPNLCNWKKQNTLHSVVVFNFNHLLKNSGEIYTVKVLIYATIIQAKTKDK